MNSGFFKADFLLQAGDLDSCVSALNQCLGESFSKTDFESPINRRIFAGIGEISTFLSLAFNLPDLIIGEASQIFCKGFDCFLDQLWLNTLYHGEMNLLMVERDHPQIGSIVPDKKAIGEHILSLLEKGLILFDEEDQYNFLNLPLIDLALLQKMDDDFAKEVKTIVNSGVKRIRKKRVVDSIGDWSQADPAGFFRYFLKEEYFIPHKRNKSSGLNWALIDRFMPSYFPSLLIAMEKVDSIITREELSELKFYAAFHFQSIDPIIWLEAEKKRVWRFIESK